MATAPSSNVGVLKNPYGHTVPIKLSLWLHLLSFFVLIRIESARMALALVSAGIAYCFWLESGRGFRKGFEDQFDFLGHWLIQEPGKPPQSSTSSVCQFGCIGHLYSPPFCRVWN